MPDHLTITLAGDDLELVLINLLWLSHCSACEVLIRLDSVAGPSLKWQLSLPGRGVRAEITGLSPDQRVAGLSAANQLILRDAGWAGPFAPVPTYVRQWPASCDLVQTRPICVEALAIGHHIFGLTDPDLTVRAGVAVPLQQPLFR